MKTENKIRMGLLALVWVVALASLAVAPVAAYGGPICPCGYDWEHHQCIECFTCGPHDDGTCPEGETCQMTSEGYWTEWGPTHNGECPWYAPAEACEEFCVPGSGPGCGPSMKTAHHHREYIEPNYECVDIVCPEGQHLCGGECVDDVCGIDFVCEPGFHCEENACVADPVVQSSAPPAPQWGLFPGAPGGSCAALSDEPTVSLGVYDDEVLYVTTEHDGFHGLEVDYYSPEGDDLTCAPDGTRVYFRQTCQVQRWSGVGRLTATVPSTRVLRVVDRPSFATDARPTSVIITNGHVDYTATADDGLLDISMERIPLPCVPWGGLGGYSFAQLYGVVG